MVILLTCVGLYIVSSFVTTLVWNEMQRRRRHALLLANGPCKHPQYMLITQDRVVAEARLRETVCVGCDETILCERFR